MTMADIMHRFVLRVPAHVLIVVAVSALIAGVALAGLGQPSAAQWTWAAGTIPVLIGLLLSMVRDILAGRMGVDAIAFISMAAALALGEPLAAVVVAVMYAGGNTLEDYAVGRAERDLKALVDRAPRIAHRKKGDTIEDVPVEDVVLGDVLIVRAGQVVPVDGLVAGDGAVLDESALTGEPIPVQRRRGEGVRSGAINAGDTFQMKASASAGESTYAGIVRMATAAQTAKAPFIRLADQYALLLLPITLLVAAAAWLYSGDAVRGLAVLVAATPCPLIIAAPVAFIAGVSQAARNGILIKGGGPLEALARTETVMFDKTGTLTVGGARLIAVETQPGEDSTEVLRLAASLEQASHHVVSEAIVKAALGRDLALDVPGTVKETMGSGLEGTVGQRTVRVGSHDFVVGRRKPEDWSLRVLRRAGWRSALSVFVAVDGRVVGALLLGDELRPETPRAVEMLRAAGVKRVVMVTGDRADAAETIGAALNLDLVLADRVPADKVDAVASEQRLSPTVMVGDGINDAPALAAANVGVAMGARGASASSEAADVVVLVDRLDKVPQALAIAKRTRAIAVQSIIAGLALSGIAMMFASAGYLTPVAGAVSQEAIDIAVILNALRALVPARSLLHAPPMPQDALRALRQEHEQLTSKLDRLRELADALDNADAAAAIAIIQEANRLAAAIVAHERQDDSQVYPSLAGYLGSSYGLGAMARAHREIMHLARLLDHIALELSPRDVDRYLMRDAQRVIEAIESLVRLHNAQEDDMYEDASSSASRR